jgi:hypothetical protein
MAIDYSKMVKHVGILNNTGKNIVVAFMSLPDDENHALVIDTDALPDEYNDALRRIVDSTEGQQAKDLATVLGRRPDPLGSGTFLQKLHAAGRLHKVPTNLITMTPQKGVRWPLTEVLKAMAAQEESQPQGFDDLDPETRAAVAANMNTFNVHTNNMDSLASADKRANAMSLIQQAELMERDAYNMRIKAYGIDPTVIPNKGKITSAPVDASLTLLEGETDKPKKGKKPLID